MNGSVICTSTSTSTINSYIHIYICFCGYVDLLLTFRRPDVIKIRITRPFTAISAGNISRTLHINMEKSFLFHRKFSVIFCSEGCKRVYLGFDFLAFVVFKVIQNFRLEVD